MSPDQVWGFTAQSPVVPNRPGYIKGFKVPDHRLGRPPLKSDLGAVPQRCNNNKPAMKNHVLSSVTMNSDDFKAYRNLFKGRDDVVAEYWENKAGKKGYSPICSLKWDETMCALSNSNDLEGGCKKCDHPEYTPLSDKLIHDHMTGKKLLGVYPLLKDNTCNFIAADFDKHKDTDPEPYDDVIKFVTVCWKNKIPAYALRSKSGNGYHVYTFFWRPIEAWRARVMYQALLHEAGTLPSFDCLFPKQDKISGTDLGNLISLPFHGTAVKKGNTLFLDPDTEYTEPYTDQSAIIQEIECSSEGQRLKIMDRYLKYMINVPQSEQWTPNDTSADFDLIKEGCRFIRHCCDDAKDLKEPEWYALLTVIAKCKDSERLAHEHSKAHDGYTKSETNSKLEHADNAKPYTCEYISQKFNGDYCEGCPQMSKKGSPIRLGFQPQKEQEEGKGYCFESPSLEHFAKIPIKRRRAILVPFIKEGFIGMVFGPRGSGKTFFIMACINAIVRGDAFGPWGCCMPVKTLFLDAELAHDDVVDRFSPILNKTLKAELLVHSSAVDADRGHKVPALEDEKWREGFKKHLIEQGVKFFVIDNISSMTVDDENAKDVWSPINQWLISLRHAGITTFIIHHAGKSGDQRGTSGREDNMDVVIKLAQPHGYQVADGCRFTVNFVKSRMPRAELHYLKKIEMSYDDATGKWSYGAVEEGNRDLKTEALRLRVEGKTYQEIADTVGKAKGTISSWMKKFKEKAILDKDGKLTPKGEHHICQI
ncbi:MAG: AAA family ATPase [Dissulfuribacterales bacterium]